MDIKVLDPQGKWYINTGGFTFIDADSGMRFDPGVTTKATPTKWLGKQAAIIRETADPLQSTTPAKPVIKPDPPKK